MHAIAVACQQGEIPANVAIVIAATPDAPAIQVAKDINLNTAIVAPDEPEYGQRLLQKLQEARTDWVCLAGYLRLLPTEVLEAYPKRVINIHPALLPNHGGKGMFGRRVHEAVLAAGDQESGCTVHYVDENYDEGDIILQRRCSVLRTDTPETLAARVLAEEHRVYVEALKQLLNQNGPA